MPISIPYKYTQTDDGLEIHAEVHGAAGDQAPSDARSYPRGALSLWTGHRSPLLVPTTSLLVLVTCACLLLLPPSVVANPALSYTSKSVLSFYVSGPVARQPGDDFQGVWPDITYQFQDANSIVPVAYRGPTFNFTRGTRVSFSVNQL